jgi:hypothetical protein
VGKRPRQLRMLPLIAASLVMVLASVPALASQATDLVPENPATPPVQDDPASEPAGAAPGCDHAAGEFLVGYTSEEALQAASPENVVETLDGILAQHLAFEEIMNIPDQAERLAAEEAKGQELGARPGVAYAEYNCVATAQAASAERAADLPTPASCGDCGSYVVDRAKEVIADGFGDAEGRDAFDAALEAARSTGPDDENVAFASEVELDDEASADGKSDSDSDGSSADERMTARTVAPATMPCPKVQGPGEPEGRPQMTTNPAPKRKPTTRKPLLEIPKTRPKRRIARVMVRCPSPERTRPRRRASPAKRAAPAASNGSGRRRSSPRGRRLRGPQDLLELAPGLSRELCPRGAWNFKVPGE